jgi:hypothetical protein
VQPGKEDITPEPICSNRRGMMEKSGRTIVNPDKSGDKFRTVECLEDLDPLAELSEYLDVLSNGTRLKILVPGEKSVLNPGDLAGGGDQLREYKKTS